MPHRPNSTSYGLNIKQPVRNGLLLLVAMSCCIVAIATFELRVGQNFSAHKIGRSAAIDVLHEHGGRVEHIQTHVGAQVKQGDLLLSLDTTMIGTRIAAMKLEAEASQAEISGLKSEAFALLQTADAHSGSREKLIEIEKKVLSFERKSVELDARIERAERDLPDMQVRASTGGQVDRIFASSPGTVLAPGAAAVRIIPPGRGVQLDTALTPSERQVLQVGRRVSVWRTGQWAALFKTSTVSIAGIAPPPRPSNGPQGTGGHDTGEIIQFATVELNAALDATDPADAALTLFAETSRTTLWAVISRTVRAARQSTVSISMLKDNQP
jgi:multidrug resistance efflux pump